MVSLLALVEADEHDPNGLLTSRAFKSKMRNVVDNNGYPMFDPNANQILSLPISYASKQIIDKEKALALIGDWDYATIRSLYKTSSMQYQQMHNYQQSLVLIINL